MTTIAPEAAAVTALPTIVPAAVGIGRASRGHRPGGERGHRRETPNVLLWAKVGGALIRFREGGQSASVTG